MSHSFIHAPSGTSIMKFKTLVATLKSEKMFHYQFYVLQAPFHILVLELEYHQRTNK